MFHARCALAVLEWVAHARNNRSVTGGRGRRTKNPGNNRLPLQRAVQVTVATHVRWAKQTNRDRLLCALPTHPLIRPHPYLASVTPGTPIPPPFHP